MVLTSAILDWDHFLVVEGEEIEGILLVNPIPIIFNHQDGR
jgi:uncharacterized membrane protein